MLRTIMIFPHFDNMEIINIIREKYDPLARLVKPHITLVFPFESDITNAELEDVLDNCLKSIKPFPIVLHGFSKEEDKFGNYLFLDMKKGSDVVGAIHNKLYAEWFKAYDLGLPYVPHITVGKFERMQECNTAFEDVKDIDNRFETIVDKVSVEMIGEKEESIIVIEKELK